MPLDVTKNNLLRFGYGNTTFVDWCSVSNPHVAALVSESKTVSLVFKFPKFQRCTYIVYHFSSSFHNPHGAEQSMSRDPCTRSIVTSSIALRHTHTHTHTLKAHCC